MRDNRHMKKKKKEDKRDENVLSKERTVEEIEEIKDR